MKVIKQKSEIIEIPAKFRETAAEMWDDMIESYEEFPFIPEDDGYFIFVENGIDSISAFPHLSGDGLYKRPWESVVYYVELGLYVIIIMCNNQFGLTVFFDENGLDERLLAIFLEEREFPT